METHEDLAGELTEISNGKASVTEQTDAWCRFDLNGQELASPLALLCNVDVPLSKVEKSRAVKWIIWVVF